MKICPSCEAGYPDALTACPLHGGLLSEIRDLKPGLLVRNTYRIQRKLSKGGMSHVYLAQHILLNEPQVLKFLSQDLSSDQDWASRFLREVRTLRQIRHKNVVQAGNVEPAEDGTLFFSMEYVEGPDLLEFYRHAAKPFDVSLALQLVYEIAEGLGAAHAAGVVHRDIKPENILLAFDGNTLVPKIADFGIVATRGDSRLTQSGNTLLTPQFAAPEQWLGKRTSELDGRTDFYALGGLLFELLVGACAFKAENYHDWAQQHLHAPVPAPSSLRPDLEEWRGLDEFVLRLLAKDPADRPADVAEVLRLIKGIRYVPNAGAAEGESSKPKLQSGGEAKSAEAEDQREYRSAFVSQPATVVAPMPAHPAAPALTPMRSRGSRTLGWLAAAAVVVALVFAARRLSPVPSRVLSNHKDAVFAVSFAPNGIGLASASRDGTVQFWDSRQGRPLGTISANTTSLAFNSDGHSIATGMADDSINLWDAENGSVLATLVGHKGIVAALAFSPDGARLASGSWDNTVRIWEVGSGRLLQTFHGSTDHVLAVAWSPDGQSVASAGADKSIRIWNVAQGSLQRTLRGHTAAINSLALSPDGRILASGSDDDTVRLWNLDARSGAGTMRTLQGHSGPVLSISFSPDGRMLASASADGTVRLWDVVKGETLRTLKGHSGPALCVAFSPSGYTVASSGSDKTIRLWEVASLRQ